jgi:hypothetical protein
MLPSFLIFKGSMPAVSLQDILPKTWGYAKSENGKIIFNLM